MKLRWKIGVVFLVILVVGALVVFIVSRGSPKNVRNTNQGAPSTQSDTPKTSKLAFDYPIFDPEVVSHITPLGELNGGYSEAQAMTGVVINLKASAVAGGTKIPVRAPADMTLEYYAYAKDPIGGKAQWTLLFRLSPQHVMRFDHISDASQAILDTTTTTPSNTSAEQTPKSKVKIKAGEEFARTSGTDQAHNWNIYFFEDGHQNGYANKSRFKSTQATQRMLSAVCPFDYYAAETKAKYYALLGYSQAGQSTTCGNPSRDKVGTIAGQWFLSSDPSTGIQESQDGEYHSPIALYRNSAGEIILDHFGGRRIDIPAKHASNKDPETVTTKHCYAASNGYVFAELKNETTLAVAYSRSGSCPAELPTNHKLYYR